jgi:hypothetical protein
MEPRPIPECYWVLEGEILAGEYPSARGETAARARLRAFIEAGIDLFLDLTEEGELEPYEPVLGEAADAAGHEVEYERWPVPDMGVPEPARMERLLDRIDEALASGTKVYIHCWGGVGRTGTAVGCFLVRRGRDGEAALAEIADLWYQMSPDKRMFHPRSPETAEQCAYVRSWSEREKGVAS